MPNDPHRRDKPHRSAMQQASGILVSIARNTLRMANRPEQRLPLILAGREELDWF